MKMPARVESVAVAFHTRAWPVNPIPALAIAAEQQRDPRARADAPDADHLTREIGQLELLQQHPPIELERLTITTQHLVMLIEDLIAPLARWRQLFDRHDQRRLINDRRLPVNDLVSFENAVMLSFVRVFASPFSARLTNFGLNCEPNSCNTFSMFRCEIADRKDREAPRFRGLRKLEEAVEREADKII
jgi:hypothetical protein